MVSLCKKALLHTLKMEIDEDTFERYIEYGEDNDLISDPATPEEKQNLRKN